MAHAVVALAQPAVTLDREGVTWVTMAAKPLDRAARFVDDATWLAAQ